jgi:hypothetical protein
MEVENTYKGNILIKHDLKKYSILNPVPILMSLAEEQPDGMFISYWNDGWISDPYFPTDADLNNFKTNFISFLSDAEALVWKLKHCKPK